MRIALVHDYLKEYGGAERVLQELHQIYPGAPIYTAFMMPGTIAQEEFKRAKVVRSWADLLIRYKNLHSILRFLVPLIWESFDFSKFDVVILSSSGYLTKPIRIPEGVKVICYCHTPPRFLYGYQTQVEWQRYFLPRLYGHVIGHFLRLYDFLGAKRVDQFVANSENIARRIKKFYGRDSVVIYPPVKSEEISAFVNKMGPIKRGDFFLWAGRIVGGKNLPMVMEAANKLGVKLKVVGESAGLRWGDKDIDAQRSDNIEFLGRLSDEELFRLYATCKAFIVAEKDVDFGIVQIEAMAAGAPIIALRSGGYIETVIEEKTGIFFEEPTVKSLAEAMKRIDKTRISKEDCQRQAAKFSTERFVKDIKKIVQKYA